MTETKTTHKLSRHKNSKKVVVFGAGNIGKLIISFLSKSHSVSVFDGQQENVNWVKGKGLEAQRIDLSNIFVDIKRELFLDLVEKLQGTDLIINSCPHFFNVAIAQIAREVDCSYIDLSEDVESGKRIQELAEGASGFFVPRCGVAPGLVQIVAGDLAKKFETLDEVKLRVGALANKANNALGYARTWSTDGLINEYANPCEAVINRELTTVQPLEGKEKVILNDVEYEAFNTSGGLGTLVHSLEANTINYKTLRYPGHVDLMKFLMFDMKMVNKRTILKQVLEEAIPETKEDHVVVYVSVSGWIEGKYQEKSYLHRFKASPFEGWTGIQLVTGGSASCVAEMILAGDFDTPGYINQEDIDFNKFSGKSHWQIIQ